MEYQIQCYKVVNKEVTPTFSVLLFCALPQRDLPNINKVIKEGVITEADLAHYLMTGYIDNGPATDLYSFVKKLSKRYNSQDTRMFLDKGYGTLRLGLGDYFQFREKETLSSVINHNQL